MTKPILHIVFVAAGLEFLFIPSAYNQGTNTPNSTAQNDQTTFNTVCGACHAASSVNGLRTEAEWKETVEHMISIGARGTDEQFEAVMRVLERTLTKINVNVAAPAEIAAVFDVSVVAAESIARYRQEHGKYKNIEDLKKVPGLDYAKLESRRERIVF